MTGGSMGASYFSRIRAFWRAYLEALLKTPQILPRLAFRKRTLEEELQEALLRGSLRKAFGTFSLVMLGMGIVIGSGWAQLSGYAAQQYAGPAVVLSYVLSGIAALLSAACFAELAVEFPVSGGAFSYVMITFGELAAWVTVASLLLEYALGMAVVARGFSRYLARLCNSSPDLFTVDVDGQTFDFMAAGVVTIMSILLSLGVRESAAAISSVTVFKIVLLIFISIVGWVAGTWDNAQPFIDPDFHVDGIFLGAAAIFFTYTGFDAICNAAEEARDVRHIPWALMATVTSSMVLYVCLAFALVVITVASPLPQAVGYAGVSYPALCACSPSLSFIPAFVNLQGMKWMQYIVSLAALTGIITALTVGLFSVSRIVMAASRDWLLPPFLARISPRTQTPLIAQLVFGTIIALLAMLVEVESGTALVSFGTLVVLWTVCNCQLYRRYFPGVQLRFTRYGTVELAPRNEFKSWVPGRHLSVSTRKWLVWVHLLAVNATSIGLGAYYAATTKDVYMELPTSYNECTEAVDEAAYGPYTCQYTPGGTPCTCAVQPADCKGEELGHNDTSSAWFALAWFLVTLSFQLCCPLEYQPSGWHVPWWLMPWLPSAAVGLVVFSVGALANQEYWKIGVYYGAALAFYLCFSLPMSYIKHSRVDYVNTDELKVVELQFIGGQWQPARLPGMFPPPTPAPSIPLRASTDFKGSDGKQRLAAACSGASGGSRPGGLGSGQMGLQGSGVSAASSHRAMQQSMQLPTVQEGADG